MKTRFLKSAIIASTAAILISAVSFGVNYVSALSNPSQTPDASSGVGPTFTGLTVTGGTDLQGGVTVTGNSDFDGSVNFNDTVSIADPFGLVLTSGGGLEIPGVIKNTLGAANVPVKIGDDLNVTGDSKFDGDVDVRGNVMIGTGSRAVLGLENNGISTTGDNLYLNSDSGYDVQVGSDGDSTDLTVHGNVTVVDDLFLTSTSVDYLRREPSQLHLKSSDDLLLDTSSAEIRLKPTGQIEIIGGLEAKGSSPLNLNDDVIILGDVSIIGRIIAQLADTDLKNLNIFPNGKITLPSDDGRINNGEGNPILQTWWRSDLGDYTAINSGYAWTGEEPVSVIAGNTGVYFFKGSGGTPYQRQLGKIDLYGNLSTAGDLTAGDDVYADSVYANNFVKMPASYNHAVVSSARDAYIDPNGYIGYLSSSRDTKHDIKDMEDVSWLYDLRPVNFIYNGDETNSKQYGLVAEEVEPVNKSFVSYDKNGDIATVSYSRLITPVIKALQDQMKEIEELKKENAEMKDALCELKSDFDFCL